MLAQKKNHGTESSKNTLFLKLMINSTLTLMDGHMQVTQVHRDHTIAPLAPMFASEEPSVTLTTKLAYMLESLFPELMLKLCQDNGNSKLDHVSALTKVTTFTWLDIFL